jgi:hypothetical protein
MGTVIQCIATDLVVLAINTLQVAVCKEDVTNAIITRDHRFLAHMGKDG